MFKWLAKLLLSPAKMVEMFTVTIKSDDSAQSVTSRVEAACETHKFALLHSYAYHDIVESKGFPIKRKAYVYEICQAKVASMMLTSHPFFAPFMPCRIAIYEEGGKTVISTMNMEVMLESIKSDKALYREANTLFMTLQSLMKQISQ